MKTQKGKKLIKIYTKYKHVPHYYIRDEKGNFVAAFLGFFIQSSDYLYKSSEELSAFKAKALELANLFFDHVHRMQCMNAKKYEERMTKVSPNE